jgi:environmental stress-induced protein Ves
VNVPDRRRVAHGTGPQRIDLCAIAPQPWKNGAGLTREIAFGGTSATDFDWRLSVADVGRDAPFSCFPGVDRCIVLLRGPGLHLRSGDGAVDHALVERLTPFRFTGDQPLAATLQGGPSQDFNVMTRRGAFRSEVDVHRRAVEFVGGDVTLLLGVAGTWQVTAGAAHTLGPMAALLWCVPAGTLRCEPSRDAAALLAVRLCHDHRP